MFFDTEKWSKRETKVFYLISLAIYFTITLLIPALIVVWKYKLFQKGGGFEISGMCIILGIVVLSVGLIKIKEKIHNWQAESLKAFRLKMALEMCFALFIPIIVIVGLLCMKDNFKLGYSTAKLIAIFYVIGIVFDYFVVKFIEREMNYIDEAQHKVEVAKRESKI